MSNNKLIVAAAGSGKTSFLVKEALKITDKRVLITTFTEANEAEIRNRVIEKNKCVPANITVQTWFSALLQHGVRPYQNHHFIHDIKGMLLMNKQSARGIKETDEAYYFNKQHKIYSDKISRFIVKCNTTSEGKVIERLSGIYTHLFIDEVQDLSGYDLELLKLLFTSNIGILLVGDPRQGTYSTNPSAKNKQYSKSNILEFFRTVSNLEIDDKKLTINHRSIPIICDLSNKLFLELPQAQPGNTNTTGHGGAFLVRQKDVERYLQLYKSMQLRDRNTTKTNDNFSSMNFGVSKGCAFDRVLIYPTDPIKQWLRDNNSELKPTSRSKLYVAITRARYSVAFVYDYQDDEDIKGFVKYVP